MFAQIKLYLFGAAIVAVLAGDAYLSVHFYNKGWNAAVAKIAAKDKEAIDAVNKATSEVDACYSGGGTWDASSGLCQH